MKLEVIDFIAGWNGGILGLLGGHPLDTIKVRQQKYGTSLLKSIIATWRFEGMRGFYRGMLFPFITIGPSNSLFFGAYRTYLCFLDAEYCASRIVLDMATICHIGWAGAVAGSLQSIFFCPIEVVKTTLQANTIVGSSWYSNSPQGKKKNVPKYTSNLMDCLKFVYKSQGLRGFFRGCLPMLIRDGPTTAIYTITYEVLLYDLFISCTSPSLVKQLVAGGTAGLTSWILVIPFDVIKSRMQSDDPLNPEYKGMIDCFRKTIKNEGIWVLGKGLPMILSRGILTNALIIFGYESSLVFYKHVLSIILK